MANDNAEYWDTVMDGFVRHFQRHADWLQNVLVGAAPHRIEQVERQVGRPLPPEYRAFLARMGETPPGALDPFLADTVFGIRALQAMYSQPGFRAPDDAVFLWTYEHDAPYDIFLDTRGGERDARGFFQAGWSVDEATGALLPEPPELMPAGGPLMRALWTDAFLKLRDPLLGPSVQLCDGAAADASDEGQSRLRTGFLALAAQLGFSAVPFVDGDLVFFDRRDASLKLYAQPGANVLHVRAADERELGRLSEVLADGLGLSILR